MRLRNTSADAPQELSYRNQPNRKIFRFGNTSAVAPRATLARVRGLHREQQGAVEHGQAQKAAQAAAARHRAGAGRRRRHAGCLGGNRGKRNADGPNADVPNADVPYADGPNADGQNADCPNGTTPKPRPSCFAITPDHAALYVITQIGMCVKQT